MTNPDLLLGNYLLFYRRDVQFVNIRVVVISQVINFVLVDVVLIAVQCESVGSILVGREWKGERSF